jgi:hypothetical protein
VYSWSIFWALWANAVEACDSTPAASNAVLHRRIEAVERDILAPCAKKKGIPGKPERWDGRDEWDFWCRL